MNCVNCGGPLGPYVECVYCGTRHARSFGWLQARTVNVDITRTSTTPTTGLDIERAMMGLPPLTLPVKE